MKLDRIWADWSPRALSVLRIITGLLFLEHGTAKHLKFPHIERYDMLDPISLSGVAGLIELVLGPFLLFGLFTRPVAFILSGEMAAAYFISHAPRDFFPLLNGGDAAVLYCFVFFYFVFAGPGACSIDVFMQDRRRKPRKRSRRSP